MEPVVDAAEIARRITGGKKAEDKSVEKATEKTNESTAEKNTGKPVSPTEKKVAETPKEFTLESFNTEFGTKLEKNEDIRSFIDSHGKYNELTPKYEELQTKYNKLELDSKVDPFADDFVKGLNDLVKNGATANQREAYVKLNSVDFDALSPEDRVKLSYELKDGLTAHEARVSFDDEFSINERDYEIDEDGDEEKQKNDIVRQIEKEKIRLKKESNIAGTYLKDYRKEISAKPENQLEKQWKEYEPKTKEIASGIANSYSGFEIANGKEGDDARKYSIAVPEDFKKQIPKIVENYLAGQFASEQPVTLNEQGINQIKSYIDLTLKAVHFDKFMLESNANTEADVTEKMTNKFSNSGDPKKGDHTSTNEERKDSVSLYKQKMLT